MPNDCISYQDSGYFTPIMVDYLNQKSELKSLYNRFPTLANFSGQIAEKKANFTGDRKLLADVLREQYQGLRNADATLENIALLEKENTFTIVTGHQLNLFTGPLYFLYKIISTINLCRELAAAYPQNSFVPVYWMATEDHDFEEINYFNFKGKKFRWNRDSGGAVGRISTDGLDEVLAVWSTELGESDMAKNLKDWFEQAYLQHDNLADATRFLAHKIFGDSGLVIIDADDKRLKSQFVPFVKDELLNQVSAQNVAKTHDVLNPYGLQVNPREINLFYLDEGTRERIIEQDGRYGVNNTDLRFSESEILDLVERHPERFSPNVILRPLYQEVILPNLCYIGGGGELAYWLELKPHFDYSRIAFPMLLLRNSALIATEKQARKADNLNLSWADLFLKQPQLRNKKVAELSSHTLDFSPQKEFLSKQFDALSEMAKTTDKSFGTAVEAQKAKQLKGLENLEKKLLRAEKRKHEDQLSRMTALQDELFPNQSLQERYSNFSEFYLEFGDALIDALMTQLKPLEQQFNVVVR